MRQRGRGGRCRPRSLGARPRDTPGACRSLRVRAELAGTCGHRAMQVGRLLARAARTNPLRGQTWSALEEIRIASAPQRPAAPSSDSSRGRISRSWQPDATTSRWRPWPNPGFRMFRLVQHEWEGTGMHMRYLWAAHPAIAGGSVHHVHAVSSRLTPSPPSRCQAAWSSVPTTPFTTVPGTQKALSLFEKGPLTSLVAGEGFEPSTSGL